MKKLGIRELWRGNYRIVLLSYLAILLIAVSFGLMIMRNSERILIEEIMDANQASMSQLRQIIDDGLVGVETLLYEHSIQARTIAMVEGQRGERMRTRRSYVDAVDIAENFRKSTMANSFVDSMYIMLLNDGYLLSDVGKFTIEEYYQRYFGDGTEMTLDELLAIHNEVAYKSYVNVSTGEGPRRILYLYALTIGRFRKTAVLCAYINSDVLKKVIIDSEWLAGARVSILNSNGQVVPLFGDEDELLLNKLANSPSKSTMSVRIDGVEYSFLTVDSLVSPLRYALIVPTQTFMHSRWQLVNTFLIGLILMLLVGVALGLYMVKRQYRPLRQLVNVAGHGEMPKNERIDEYGLIMNRLVDYQKENDHLYRMNSMQNIELATQRLRHVLHGMYVDSYEVDAILRACGMALRHGNYIAIMIDASAPELRPQTNLMEAYDTIVVHMRMTKPHDVDMAAIQMDQMMVVILDIPKDADIESIKAWCLRLEKDVNRQSGSVPCICISNPHVAALDIHDAYLELQAVREYQRVIGYASVLCYHDLPKETMDDDIVLLLDTQRLTNMLMVRKYEDAREFFAQIVDEKLCCGLLSSQTIICRLYGLIYTILRAFNELALPDSLYFTERLTRCNSVEMLRSEFHALLSELIALQPCTHDTKQDSNMLVEDAVAFIQERYADQMLSVVLVAEAHNVSPITLTRAFKRMLGMGVLEYIHHCRLHIAKQLIHNTKDSLGSIAQRTGYNNKVTFIRVFKKYEGVTPNQYRQMRNNQCAVR